MKTIRILILEDDLRTLSILMNGLHALEEYLLDSGIELSLMQMSEYGQVKKYLGEVENGDFT